ncbi:MAG: protease complex subunit PrcB family protein [Deferrisomatales bacterium]|nr:protease complex subunit PrcB family protein [Deferrisomatales bacterium]
MDFAREWVLRVDMGLRPTAGYALALANERAEVSDGMATLWIEWSEPHPEHLQAQMLTQPCLILAVPHGAYHTLRVLDQKGRERFRAEVPH